MGVVSAMETAACVVRAAPTITCPPTRRAAPLPRSPVTNWARPTAPPAPGLFRTSTSPTSPLFRSALRIARAVWSQPPSREAGAMMTRRSTSGSEPAAVRVAGTAARSATAAKGAEAMDLMGTPWV